MEGSRDKRPQQRYAGNSTRAADTRPRRVSKPRKTRRGGGKGAREGAEGSNKKNHNDFLESRRGCAARRAGRQSADTRPAGGERPGMRRGERAAPSGRPAATGPGPAGPPQRRRGREAGGGRGAGEGARGRPGGTPTLRMRRLSRASAAKTRSPTAESSMFTGPLAAHRQPPAQPRP